MTNAQALIIFCSHPGLIRAGRVHPLAKTHDPASFTLEQYREMLAEPSLVLARGELLTLASLEAELGVMPQPAGRGARGAVGQAAGAAPADVGLQGAVARTQRAGLEMGLSSGVATRHVADEVVLRDAAGQAVLRADGTEAIPAGGNAPTVVVQDGSMPDNALADELAVRAIEDAPRDVITGQPGPAPLADDIVAEPGDTEVQRRVEDVTARGAGRHRARRA